MEREGQLEGAIAGTAVQGDAGLEDGSLFVGEDLDEGGAAERPGAPGGGVDQIEFHPKNLAREVGVFVRVDEEFFQRLGLPDGLSWIEGLGMADALGWIEGLGMAEEWTGDAKTENIDNSIHFRVVVMASKKVWLAFHPVPGSPGRSFCSDKGQGERW